MNEAAASLSLDARALALLDELLAAGTVERDAMLAGIHATDLPLHERLSRLLVAWERAEGSHVLAAPVLCGLKGLAAPGLRAGEQLAGYRLLRELGRGGMSEVWLAERADGTLKREVALKLPIAPMASTMLAGRFARERDVLASLVHPNIARLYDAGVSDTGRPFIVLEAVQGRPIDEQADAQRLTVPQRLKLYLQVLAAVEHAHRHMTVHRDLKPSNILVADDGQVKLLDFGIAKLLSGADGSAALTQDFGSVLTPRYAAPEQILGGAISAATDVYSAAVVLYELLTGVAPYAAGALAMAEITRAVLSEEPPLPSRAGFSDEQARERGCDSAASLRHLLRGDIDTVLQVALRKAPEDRYASIERFAEDIRRVCASEPIIARRPSMSHRLRLLVRRNRGASLAVGVVGIALIGMAAVALQQNLASRAQEARAGAVRDFMFQMASDAEPDEANPQAEVTGRQMVDAAVTRARTEFAGQPLLQGELLVELGRVYARLGQHDKAVATLTQAIELLRPIALPDDPALNKARGHLAGLLIGNDPSRSEQLAREAIGACTRSDAECAKARAYAREVLATLEGQRGRAQAALEHARAWVAESERAFGSQDQNTAAALQSLAILQRNEGRFADAAQTIAQAVEMTRNTRMRASARLGLQRTQALLDLDLGRFEAARRQLADLIGHTTDPGERALQFRLLANALFGLGDPAAAVQAAAQAMVLAEQVSDPLERLLALQARSRADALLGRAEAAATALRQVAEGLVGLGFAADSREVLRARRFAAEVLLRQGDLVSAERELRMLAQAHQSAGLHQGLDWAHTLDLLGCVARAKGLFDEARRQHLAAHEQMVALLPGGHPFLLRNELYTALTGVGAAQGLTQALQRFRAGLPEASFWRTMPRAIDSSQGERSGDGERPLLVL